MERDWAGELEEYLRDRFAELCAVLGQPVPMSGLRISPPLAAEESKYFLLGLEAGLFQADEEGKVQSELLSPRDEGDARQNLFQLFSHDQTLPRFYREGVCQLSTAAWLILQRGWLKSHVRLEPRGKERHSEADSVDLLVRSPAGHILICVEVKRSVPELHKLTTDLRACCKRGPHGQDDCGFPQNHPKYEFCALSKPTYIWAVAPEAGVCLKLNYDDQSIELEHLPSLPARSMIESN